MKVGKLTKIGALLAASLLAPSAFAQSISASNTTAVINTNNHVVTITLNPAAATVDGIEVTVGFNASHLTLPAASAIVSSASQITCAVTSPTVTCSGFGIPAGVQTLQIPVNIGGTAVPAPGSLVTVTGTYREPTNGDAVPTTLNNGSVTIIEAQPDTNLGYNPAPGSTVTFPAGVALTTQNASIGITTTGTVGAGTISNCGITGTGAASFGPPPAGTISVNGGSTGTIPLTCTLPNSGGAATATLTCTETDADTPAPGAARSWTLSCPQGTPVPGPGFGASPAPNTPATAINCSGQAGTSVTRQITITNNGNPGAGSALDFTCTGGGIVSITSGGSATGLAVGASQPVNVSCAVPADGVTSTGTVSCTSNAPGGPFVFNYSSTGSTLPPPVARPAVVPASSTWSQIALIALLAGLGLAFVGFRRGQ